MLFNRLMELMIVDLKKTYIKEIVMENMANEIHEDRLKINNLLSNIPIKLELQKNCDVFYHEISLAHFIKKIGFNNKF